MSLLSEPKHDLAFLISEGPTEHSRDAIKILAGSGAVRALTAGMVLGKRSVGTATSAATAGNTGDGAMGAITVTGPARRGRYKLLIVEPGSNVGQFALFDPDGVLVAKGTVASAFSAGGLAFTLADGATDFVSGDSFSIDVSVTDEKWLQHDPAGTLGEQTAAGILCYDTTAPDGADLPNAGPAIVRGPVQVTGSELVWIGGISAANKERALLELERRGIIAR